MKSVISSLVVPIIVGTAPRPARTPSTGAWVNTEPSTTGMNSSSTRETDASALPCALSRTSTGTASSSSSVCAPVSAITVRAISVAFSRLCTNEPLPDCTIAWWNSPCAAGRPSSVATLMPPADSPKIVTRSGSPPNAAMLSRTHSSASTWSRIPAFPEPATSSPKRSSRCRNPNAPSR